MGRHLPPSRHPDWLASIGKATFNNYLFTELGEVSDTDCKEVAGESRSAQLVDKGIARLMASPA